MRQRWNGSIQSANAPTFDKPGMDRNDFGLYRCLVVKVIYVDDPNNITKNAQNPEVLYDCVILGGGPQGQSLSNCRLASWLGGDANYAEKTLTPSSKDVSKIKLAKHDGDIVWVQFVQGHDGYPVIIAQGKGLNNKVGAKKAEGPRLIENFNGLNFTINNKGEMITNMMGGTTKNGRFTEGTSSIIKEEWLSTEKLVTTFKSGLKMTLDGKSDKVDVVTKGGVTVSIDGTGNKISLKAGGTEVLIDGGSGKISLKGSMVDLGSSVADFVTQFTALASAFATHIHPFIDITPGGPVPSITQPPMAPLLSTVGSQTVKVQA
jgi:hypothetical protein